MLACLCLTAMSGNKNWGNYTILFTFGETLSSSVTVDCYRSFISLLTAFPSLRLYGLLRCLVKVIMIWMYMRKVFNKQNIETFIGVFPQRVFRSPPWMRCGIIILDQRSTCYTFRHTRFSTWTWHFEVFGRCNCPCGEPTQVGRSDAKVAYTPLQNGGQIHILNPILHRMLSPN